MSSSSSARIPESGVGNVACSQSEDSMPVPSEGLSPQTEWFKYHRKTHTVSTVNIALSNPPCSHGAAGNTGEARHPLRGQECRLEVRNPNSSSWEPSSPSHHQLPTSPLTAPAPAVAMPPSPVLFKSLLQNSLMQSPRVDAHEKKNCF